MRCTDCAQFPCECGITTPNIQQLCLAKVDAEIAPLEVELDIYNQLMPIGYTPEDIATKPRAKAYRETQLKLSAWKALRSVISIQPLEAFVGDVAQDFFDGFSYAIDEMHKLIAKELEL